jgi:hypothetical protein
MSSLDLVVPQATQLPLLKRLVELVVLGEDDTTWLQRKIGFKGLRNVWYYLEAARWVRLVEELEVRPTSLGRRYVGSRFDPRVVLEGVRGRPLFEAVMRATSGAPPTPEVVADILHRWSFRYSKGTITRRSRDFCRLFGRIFEEAASQDERRLIVHTGWLNPPDVPAIDGVATIWPAMILTPLRGLGRTRGSTSSERGDDDLLSEEGA